MASGLTERFLALALASTTLAGCGHTTPFGNMDDVQRYPHKAYSPEVNPLGVYALNERGTLVFTKRISAHPLTLRDGAPLQDSVFHPEDYVLTDEPVRVFGDTTSCRVPGKTTDSSVWKGGIGATLFGAGVGGLPGAAIAGGVVLLGSAIMDNWEKIDARDNVKCNWTRDQIAAREEWEILNGLRSRSQHYYRDSSQTGNRSGRSPSADRNYDSRCVGDLPWFAKPLHCQWHGSGNGTGGDANKLLAVRDVPQEEMTFGRFDLS